MCALALCGRRDVSVHICACQTSRSKGIMVGGQPRSNPPPIILNLLPLHGLQMVAVSLRLAKSANPCRRRRLHDFGKKGTWRRWKVVWKVGLGAGGGGCRQHSCILRSLSISLPCQCGVCCHSPPPLRPLPNSPSSCHSETWKGLC